MTQQIGWLHDALRASHGALTGQEDHARRGIDIADEGGSVGVRQSVSPRDQRQLMKISLFRIR